MKEYDGAFLGVDLHVVDCTPGHDKSRQIYLQVVWVLI